jgi:hypothetical protein
MPLNKQRAKMKVSELGGIVRKTGPPDKMAICCYLFTGAAIGQACSLVIMPWCSEI